MKAVEWKRRIKEQRDVLEQRSKIILTDAKIAFELARAQSEAKRQAANELDLLLEEDAKGADESENGGE